MNPIFNPSTEAETFACPFLTYMYGDPQVSLLASVISRWHGVGRVMHLAFDVYPQPVRSRKTKVVGKYRRVIIAHLEQREPTRQ